MIWLFAMIAAQAGNPTTVNGQELGSADDFKTAGPARVCIMDVAVDLIEGEAAYLQYAGIHRGVLRLETANGSLEIAHGDSWAEKPRGRLVYVDGKTKIYRSRLDGDIVYSFFVPTDYSDGEATKIATVSGSLMTGGQMDISILHRISVASEKPTGCARQYAYGWDMIFGDEPVSQNQQK